MANNSPPCKWSGVEWVEWNPGSMYYCGVKDYPLIVKNPMDLSTICRKLEDGEYTDPWQYVDDMQLVFSNAWLYNRRSSPVYKSCTKVLIYIRRCYIKWL